MVISIECFQQTNITTCGKYSYAGAKPERKKKERKHKRKDTF